MLYEDDGKSFDHKQGRWMGIQIQWRDADRRLSLRLAEGSRLLPPLQRAVEARVVGTTRSARFAFDGKPVDLRV